MSECAPIENVAPEGSTVARLQGVSLRYGKTLALDAVSLDIPAGSMVGFMGPDGVGKSSLFSLVAGSRAIQGGRVEVLGADMADAGNRRLICPRIAYMPQGLGKNLYPTLSVFENVDFFARLFGQDRAERERRIADLLQSTGLAPFPGRPAGKLSGGMKQKLGLCCSLIHDPDLLILDEPTTGVDPLSRRQFWELIDRIRASRSGMSVMVATAYMEEAERFDWLVAMNAGQILATGTPQNLRERTGSRTLEEAFIALLPESQRRGHTAVTIPPRETEEIGEVAIEARDLTQRFGDFTAVDHVTFRIGRGEIFGFLGSNGCGKTTTMKMLTGLLDASEGQAWLFGKPVDPKDLQTRRRVGYMTQAFSLYTELSVRQNLVLHARLFKMPENRIEARVQEMAQRFGLTEIMDSLPDSLPLGQRQRLQLAVAMIHGPEMLILDEPTSGVDPVARDSFWQSIIDLSRRDKVTIFISTHFMNEAMRCDRISLMHAGRVLVSDAPAALIKKRGTSTLEEAFIRYLEEAAAERVAASAAPPPQTAAVSTPPSPPHASPIPGAGTGFSLRRLLSYTRRESLEVRRDPMRLALAVCGSAILLTILAYGLTLDVENLSFAVLDRDQTTASRDYALNIAGSKRYFREHAPIRDYDDLARRMRSGELTIAIELPPHFARDMSRGDPVSVGAWVDGAMPERGEVARNYLPAIHAQWLSFWAAHTNRGGQPASPARIEIRYRYNPDVRSLPAMVPSAIAVLLMLIPAVLTALSVVREKELGSILNFYTTPVTRMEFLLGKQLPYIVIGMFNFLVLTLQSATMFGVPVKGSFLTLAAGSFLYVGATTAIGLLVSTFMRSQVASIVGTAVLSLLPTIQFSGMIYPVRSLEGAGAFVGRIYPTTYYIEVSRGVFNKALNFADLHASFGPLLVAVPVLLASCAVFLKKQER